MKRWSTARVLLDNPEMLFPQRLRLDPMMRIMQLELKLNQQL